MASGSRIKIIELLKGKRERELEEELRQLQSKIKEIDGKR